MSYVCVPKVMVPNISNNIIHLRSTILQCTLFYIYLGEGTKQTTLIKNRVKDIQEQVGNNQKVTGLSAALADPDFLIQC